MFERVSLSKPKASSVVLPPLMRSAQKRSSLQVPKAKSPICRDSNKPKFSLLARVSETGEGFTVLDCHWDMRVSELKSALELVAGIPADFQRLWYLDEADLMEESTLCYNDIVPGTAVTVMVWPYNGWTQLVRAAAAGDVDMLKSVMSKPDPQRSPTRLVGMAGASTWLPHRLFSALFISAHRGHMAAVRFLLQHGADVGGQTPQGRGVLHAAAAQDRVHILQELLSRGAPQDLPDHQGMTALSVATLLGHRKFTRHLLQSRWQERAAGVRLRPHLDQAELFPHQRHDSQLRTGYHGNHAQRYMAHLGGQQARGQIKTTTVTTNKTNARSVTTTIKMVED